MRNGNNPVSLEALESRQFMSAGPFSEALSPQKSRASGLVQDRAPAGRPRLIRATSLENNVSVAGLSGIRGSRRIFRIDVAAGASDLVFRMSGGRGDADLYVRYGAAPTTSDYDHRPYRSGNSERVSIATPRAGAWYVMIRGYSAYSGVTLRAGYEGESGEGGNSNDGGATGGGGGGGGGSAADGTRETWAVLLGASDYPGTENDLPDCAADAKNMGNLLRDRLGVDADHQQIVTGRNISESVINQQIGWLRQNADADDSVVFYYSGHGGYGRYKYVDDDETLWLPADQDFTESELRTHLQSLPGGTERIVMLDSCYSGGFTGLAKSVTNTMVLAASTYNEVAYGYARGRTPNRMYGGIFTSWFIYGYNADRGDSNDDGSVTMREAFSYARPNAIKNSDQTPVMAGNVLI